MALPGSNPGDERTVVPNGRLIRELRQKCGLTQEKLAFGSGLSVRRLSQFESQNASTFPGTLHLIVSRLNETKKVAVTYEQLLLNSGNGENPASILLNRLFQLPAVVADFTGREDESRRMVGVLHGKGGRVGVSALRGMGGVGKTSLAVKVAHEVKDHFPDAQLVLDLLGTSDRPISAVEAMVRVIRDFHPDATELPDTETELAPLYRSVLAGKRALILFDNARDEEQVKQLVTVPLPVGFVVTSRNALGLDGIESIRLDVLPADEALRLLRGTVGAKGSDDELRAVAGLCGRLPLALRTAGDFLRLHDNWTTAQYIEALKVEGQRLERLKGRTREKDVEAVLGLSAAELVKTKPELAKRWQMLAVFPADFDADAAAAVWDLKDGDVLDTDTATDELTDLLDRSLLQFDVPTERYSLHDLMRPVARDVFGDARSHSPQAGLPEWLYLGRLRFSWYYCTLLDFANESYRRGGEGVHRGLALFDREETNVRQGWSWSAEHYADHRNWAELRGDFPLVGAHITHLRLSPSDRVRWNARAVSAWQDLGDRDCEGAALGNLGSAYADLGDTRKAIECYQKRLAIARELHDPIGEGAALGNLGSAYADLGDARKAITFYDQRLAIAREINDRDGEGAVLGNLGSAYADLGDAARAIAFYEQQLKIARELSDPRMEGAALGNLGSAYIALKDARKAIALYDQRLAIAREINDPHGVMSTLGNLGSAYGDIGEHEKALQLYRERLDLARSMGDRRRQGSTCFKIAVSLDSLGRTGEAIEYARHALGCFQAIIADGWWTDAPAGERVQEDTRAQMPNMSTRIGACEKLLALLHQREGIAPTPPN